MRITTISYARLVNLGDYSNERISATAEVAEGDDPQHAFVELAAYVDKMAADRQLERERIAAEEDRKHRIRAARSEMERYTRELAGLEAKPEDKRVDWENERIARFKPEIKRLQQVLANPDAKPDAPERDLPF